jgi:hypothetical protein
VPVDVGRDDTADDTGADQGEQTSGSHQPPSPDLLPSLSTTDPETLVGIDRLEDRGQGPET